MTRMSAADLTPLIGSEPKGSFVTTYDMFANLVPWASALGGPTALVDAQEVGFEDIICRSFDLLQVRFWTAYDW